ncbi:MAG: preprotein translocase subunit SecG [Betaproteobacteria bacterium RIFCSPLOWO2_02_FULL_67_26]|nr:MAG: preprotein translocase subunit SecG [Betaproteobacteria bacterium RIFCSPLOWO2_02_FULL_67_26]
METLILVIHVLVALAIVGLVLLQHGKGADVGAAFGSGASGSLFGASGSANFLSRTTAVLAAVFFLTSMGLTYYSGQKTEPKGVMGPEPAPARKTLPDQIPPTAPAGQAAPAPAPAADPGSKAQDVPK